MTNRSLARPFPRVDDDREEAADDPALRTLFLRAQALIRALRAGAGETALAPHVQAYVQSAAAQGVSAFRIRDVLEFLVLEYAVAEDAPSGELRFRARRERAKAPMLRVVLRLAALSEPARRAEPPL